MQTAGPEFFSFCSQVAQDQQPVMILITNSQQSLVLQMLLAILASGSAQLAAHQDSQSFPIELLSSLLWCGVLFCSCISPCLLPWGSYQAIFQYAFKEQSQFKEQPCLLCWKNIMLLMFVVNLFFISFADCQMLIVCKFLFTSPFTL